MLTAFLNRVKMRGMSVGINGVFSIFALNISSCSSGTKKLYRYQQVRRIWSGHEPALI